MKNFIKIFVICLLTLTGNFIISIADAWNIDGLLVRGGEVDGSLCCEETIFSKSGEYNLNDPKTFNAELPKFDRNYVYKIEVLSTDFLTEYGLYGLDYKEPYSRSLTRSSQQASFRHDGALWSNSAMAYHPTWDGHHYLKIKAKNITPSGRIPKKRVGRIHINVYRWKIVKDNNIQTSPPCPVGQCGHASTFGTTNCRKSSPSCGGGMCGSPGCP